MKYRVHINFLTFVSVIRFRHHVFKQIASHVLTGLYRISKLSQLIGEIETLFQ